MSFPLSDAQPPEMPQGPYGGPYGWIVASVIVLLVAFRETWGYVTKGRREDSTTALTHANEIIKSHERYAKRRDDRIVELEQEMKRRDDEYKEEIRKLWRALGDTTRREQLCVARMEWLKDVLREHDIELPDWPRTWDTPPESSGDS